MKKVLLYNLIKLVLVLVIVLTGIGLYSLMGFIGPAILAAILLSIVIYCVDNTKED